MGRREFLKTAGAMGAAATPFTCLGGRYIYGEISRLELYQALTKDPDNAALDREIPSFLDESEIPQTNENQRDPVLLFKEAIKIYTAWLSQKPGLGRLVYRRPNNYLTLDLVAKSGISQIYELVSQGGDLSQINVNGLESTMISKFDSPGSSFINFSFEDITSPADILIKDPGSGFVRVCCDALKQKYSPDFDPYTYPQLDETLIRSVFNTRFTAITEYIDRVRSGQPVSTSVLLATCLYFNRGQILPSLWDTATYLKVAARNNLVSLEPDYQRENIHFITDRFIDDFSSAIPVEWVARHVPIEKLNLEAQERNIPKALFSDFDIYNRIGQLYHAWINIAGAACMHPRLVIGMNRLYYNLGYGNRTGINIAQNNGLIKMLSDLSTAHCAPNLNHLYSHYS